MGGTIAAALAAAGHPFVVMESDREVLQALREGGLELVREGKSERLEVEAASPRELRGSFDAVLLAVKGPRLGEAMRAVSPRMHRDTFFLALQAGWSADLLAEMVEPQRVLAGTVEFAARRVRPGGVELVAPGPVVAGELDGSLSPRLRELKELLEKGSPGLFSVTANVLGRVWWSMRLSALLGPLGALTGCSLEGDMPGELEEPFAVLLEELEELTRLEGVEPEPSPAGDDPAALAAAASPYAWSVREDLVRGEPLEREFTTGFLLDRARARGLRTPALGAFHSLLGELEKSKLAPSPAALRELLRRTAEERELGLM